MSADCADCGFDLPYEGDCLYCTARKRVAELEEAVASALTSLATGPMRDGYAYAVLSEVAPKEDDLD